MFDFSEFLDIRVVFSKVSKQSNFHELTQKNPLMVIKKVKVMMDDSDLFLRMRRVLQNAIDV